MPFKGTGPGPQTADGCSVEFYRGQPYLGELDDIEHLLIAGESVLELGCGTGRITRVLLARGHAVTAVDNSADMLDALPCEATPVLCDIESLQLDTRFDVVLLASYLVNLPDPAVRDAILRSARRHLKQPGRVFVQRHDPNWLRTVQAGATSSAHGTRYTIVRVAREPADPARVAMTLQYDRDGQTWTHSFVSAALDEQDVELALLASGFSAIEWHGARRQWATAR